MSCKTKTLNSGHKMPKVGFGTWLIDGKDIDKSVRSAIKAGYRHIDTAHIYFTEKELGQTLKNIFDEGLVKREDLFITSKLWNSYHDCVELGLRNTLKDLQLDYIDLYIVHWPVSFKADRNGKSQKDSQGYDLVREYDALKVWKELEKLVEMKLIRSIGTANHGKKNLNLILKHCKIKPAINQFEINPYMTQYDLVKYCQDHDIQVVGYSSLGSTSNKYKVREDECIQSIAEKYNKSIPQIILSWLLMRNILVIPKSTSEKHIIENIDLIDLKKEDCEKICKLNKNYRVCDIPAWGPHRFD